MPTIDISWIEMQVPAHAQGVPINPGDPCFGKRLIPRGCGCGGGAGGCGCGCGGSPNACPVGPVPACFSPEPVRYSNGEISVVQADLDSDGFGLPWGHTRSFASQSGRTRGW